MQTAQTLPAQAHPKAQVPLYDVGRLPGSYYHGDGLGSNNHLRLHSGNTFDYRLTGCLGEYGKTSGYWRLEGDVLILEPNDPVEVGAGHEMETRYIPVPWGERMYLVEENSVPAFADDSRDGDLHSLDDIHGFDYIQIDPETFEPQPASGIPVFPERFRIFYEKGAVSMEVIESMPDGTVILDKGSKDGLRPGLVLANKSGWLGGEIDILELTQTTAIGRPIYYSNSDTKVKLGDEFTTGGGWRRPCGTGAKRYATLQTEK